MSETLTQTLARAPLTYATLAAGDALGILDVSASGLSKDAAATLGDLARALFGGSTSTNASGNTTITPGVISMCHTEVTTFSGVGSTTRVIILSTANTPIANARIVSRAILPATADITIEYRNATAGGTLITSIVTDGSEDDAVGQFYWDGSAYQILTFTYPANA